MAQLVKDIVVFNEVALELFWNFVAERQRIWHRRFTLKQPAPWTDDPILRRQKFTNLYRELDPGTQYVIKKILEKDVPRPDKIFNVMLYRLMCSIPTYDGMGFQFLSKFREKEFDEYLRSVYNSGQPVFGNAYLISPYSSMGSEYKFRNISRLFGLIHRDFDAFFQRLNTAPSFENAFKVVNGLYGFGPFLAYQVMVDLTYELPDTKYKSALLPFSQNGWAKLGPGALRGFARLSPERDTLKGLRWLWVHQREEFDRMDIQFPYLLTAEGEEIDISLANMQNALCEFSKYCNIKDGTGKAQRIFVPFEGERSWVK